MQEWITQIMSNYGYFGIFFLIVVENVFPPIPSEVILTFGGFMTTRSDMNVVGVILVATLGSLIGAVILYGIGTLLNQRRLNHIVDKYGRILGLKHKDIDNAFAWYEKYENKTVFLCRMIPVVRSLISIPAGMAKMNVVTFAVLTTLGSLIWNTILVIAGRLLGDAWETILQYLDIYSNIAYVVFAVLGVGVIILYLKKRRENKKSDLN